MKRRIVTLAKWITAIQAGIVIACWAASYDAQLDLTWTQGTSLNQVTLCRGTVHVIRNDEWWRKEKLNIRFHNEPETDPVHTWIGMRIESRHAICGFERSKGTWVSPYIPVGVDTEFTTPEKQLPPKTFVRTITPLSIHCVPFWALAAALTIFGRTCEVCEQIWPKPSS